MEIREECGAILVQYQDDHTNDTRRLWFDETDDGRLVMTTAIAVVGEIRNYLDRRDWSVPEDVATALEREGFDVDPIYDLDAQPVYKP